MSKQVKDDVTKAERVALARELRYMNPENIAKDFKSKRERAVIAAVFEWLSLNAICAWSLKRPGTYSTTAWSKNVRREMGTSDAIVLSDEQYERAMAILVSPKKKTVLDKKRPSPKQHA